MVYGDTVPDRENRPFLVPTSVTGTKLILYGTVWNQNHFGKSRLDFLRMNRMPLDDIELKSDFQRPKVQFVRSRPTRLGTLTSL